ncbi:MAG: hypothetical protein QG626_251 [Patescibacteria group bacterium]|jgi:hypothetical protein|nr:hypothetical protein [Patescibacteria group bacterium]MDQ5952124.1 hypothetical protein [Patescibacteria group bacterium]
MAFPARKLIIEQLEMMASVDYQKKEWTENVKSTWFTPTEILSTWFDDLDFRDEKPGFKENFSSAEWDALMGVTTALVEFKRDFTVDEETLVADITSYLPWRKVIDASSAALDVLRA